MTVAFYTLGCKTNQFETQALERLFIANGHQIVPFSDFADVYIVNTCTVTAMSDKKSRAAARKCKRINPDAKLIVCGCYAQLNEQEVYELCGADHVVGSTDKGSILQLAEQGTGAKVRRLWDGETPDFELLPAGNLSGRTRAYLKIQDGCQNFCSYCVIPYARGPSRSMPFDRCVEQAASLGDEDYREIVVTGIEISSYGLDLPEKPTLLSLIQAICQAAPNARIRLGSLEPSIVTEQFAQSCALLKNLCPHFHISLQSGCDQTLTAMKRKYSAQGFADACANLRKYFENCAITTDLIVGFPGESVQHFTQSLDFVRSMGLAQVHIFPFSRREGTAAYSMPKQLDRVEKQRRAAQAAQICMQQTELYMQSLIGTCTEVLFEHEHNGIGIGHSAQYIGVRVLGSDLAGRTLPVKIVSVHNDMLKGELLDE